MQRHGLQDVLKDLETPEPEKQLKVIQDEELKKTLDLLLEIYNKAYICAAWLDAGYAEFHSDTEIFIRNIMKETQKRVLTPQTIFEFIVTLAEKYDLSNIQNKERFFENTGLFLSALIRQAYQHGHTKFYLPLNLLKEKVYNLSNLSGEKNRPLEIVVLGCFSGFNDFNYINLTICGDFATSSIAPYNKAFTFYSEFGAHTDGSAKHCTFKSPNEDVLAQIKRNAGSGNKYYLLKDGMEIPYVK